MRQDRLCDAVRCRGPAVDLRDGRGDKTAFTVG